jgi:hypothetical protein
MKERYLSGEEYKAQRRGLQTPRHPFIKRLGIGMVLLAFLGAAVYGGMQYAKSQQPQATNPSGGSPASNGDGISNGGGSGNASSGQRSTGVGSVTGAVTVINDSSITIKPSSGGTKTFAISSNTTITNAAAQSFGSADSGQSAASSIKIGNTVLVTPDKANPNQAIGILINPQ